jgi:multiple sugar transport system substrate-binding protein
LIVHKLSKILGKGEDSTMKSKFWVFLTLLITVSMLLASCQPAATPPPAAAPVEPTATTKVEEAKPAEPTATTAAEAPAEATATEGPTAEPTATEWVPLQVKEGQTKVLIFVGFGTGTSPEQQAAHKKIQDAYNSTHDKIQIEFVTVPHAERITKFSTMLAGDMAPDIVMPIGVGGIAEFYDEWADLTPYITKDKYDMSRFIGTTTEIHKYPEKGILGLPMCVYPSVVFYNMDVFDAAGVEYPPHKFGEKYADGSAWDYNKVIEISKKMSLDANGNDANSPAFDAKNMKQWGWDGFDWMQNWEDYAQKFGPDNGTGVSQDFRTALFTTQTYKDSLSWVKDAIYTHHIQANSEQAGAFYDQSGDPFGSGMVGMWEIQSWMKYAWDSWDKAFSWDVAAIPTGPNGKIISVTDADTFVIPKSSKHKDEAWEVIKWFYENENLKQLIDNYGCIPADKDLAASWATDTGTKYPNVDLQVFLDALDYTDWPNHEAYHPQYAKIHDAETKGFDSMNTGKNLDVNAICEEVQKEAQALLDEYWKNK